MAYLLAAGCGSQPDGGPKTQPESDPIAMMEQAMQAGDWPLADRFAKQAVIARPNDPELLTKVAHVAALCDRKRDAAILLIDAAALANYEPISRVNFAIQALVDVGEIYLAIDLLEKSLRVHPENDSQRKFLVGFLGEIQRIDRIPPHMKKLIEKRNFDFRLLISCTETSSRRFSDKTSSRLLERNPDDRRVRLAEAFLLMYRRDAQGAADVLEDILKHHPDFAPAQAMYGQALSSSSERWQELPQWLAKTPPDSKNFADYWLTVGDMETESGRYAEAARAYWEGTRRDPNSSPTWDRLRLSIHRLRSSESVYRDDVSDQQLEVILDYARELLAFREHFNDFTGGGQMSQQSATEVALALFNLGRYWEAEAWSAAATTLSNEPSPELPALRRKIRGKLQRQSDWFAKDHPAFALDLSSLPAPEVNGQWNVPKRSTVIPSIASVDHLRMTERSIQWGLESIGKGNNPTNARLAALIRSTGVGGGAIDYDLDGLPDLLMMNAGGTMLLADSMPNELMRNTGKQFVRVSDPAGVSDRGFGQGMATGDFNEDGFPDLFFANLGKNRLFRNNGDGTFSDCSDRLESNDPRSWSTSGSFVDMNGDGIADLLFTNYCKTVHDLDKACPNQEGVLGPCHPLKFPADADQFRAGTPDGRLADVTSQWVSQVSPGRGLGIVSGTIDAKNLGIFVANDMSQNSFYSRVGEDPMRLVDSAAARGVAVDGRALAQASMGIASSDFDRDGDLDFYVTGFGREYNVYYEQISPGLWKDETSKLALVQPTLNMIGFGTEAIDLDNDGIEEIIVANGHIGEFTTPDSPPYEQPIQIFRRGPQGTFGLLDDDGWGEYFSTAHVGRALWTTDVNRDGRNDVMITHNYEQVRLLVNESTDQNDRIAFRLVATDCSRDATGAVIRFDHDGQQRTLWQLSGDGYFCSNERTLIAGLGTAERVSNVTITWQDGSVDEIGSLPTNSQFLIVQGQGEAFPLLDYDR